MRVVEIILSKETRDRDISPAEKKEVGLLKKKINQYMDALSGPGTTPAERASLHKKMTTAVAEVKKITKLLPDSTESTITTVPELETEESHQKEVEDSGEQINELFTGDKEWQWEDIGQNECSAVFTIQEQQYTFTAWTDENANNTWEVQFIADDAKRGQKFAVTGSGNAAEVMGTVTSIMKDFLDKYEVKGIIMSAKEASRQRLYKAMIHRLLPKWDIEADDGQLFITPPPANMMESEVPIEAIQYEVYDSQTGQKVGKVCTTRAGARRAVDRLDNAYGAYRYRYRPVPVHNKTPVMELMTGTTDYNVEENTDGSFVASFWIGEVPYLYRALKNIKTGIWLIEFIDNSRSDSDMYKMTGTGNASQVMGTVLNLTQDFMSQHADVKGISFMAKEQSRDSLYKRIANKLLPDWKMEQKGYVITLTAPSEQITELFQNKAEWRWTFKGSEEVNAEFKVGEIPYILYAYTDGNEEKAWELEFSATGSDRNRFGITGSGKAVEVFSTVIDIMRSFLKDYSSKVGKLIFSAKEPSRKKLYFHLISKLMSNWGVDEEGDTIIVTNPILSKKASPVMEAIHKVPLTEEDFEDIKTMMERPVPAALGLIYLQEVIVDDEFNDVLQSIQESDPNRDIRPLIAEWINRVMPDQLWRFGIGVQSDLERAGLFSPIHGYDPKEFYKQNQKSSSNKYGRN